MFPDSGELTLANVEAFMAELHRLLGRTPFACIKHPQVQFFDGCMLESMSVSTYRQPSELCIVMNKSTASITILPQGVQDSFFHGAKYFIEGKVVCILQVYGSEPTLEYCYFVGR